MASEEFSADVVELIPKLRAYARALTRDSSDCDDLVQETLAKALKYENRFEKGTKLKAWLFTIMRNAFYTSAKKSTRERPGLADCVSDSVLVNPVHDSIILHKQVMRAIDRLPTQFREMLILVVMLGESYENAARICGCAVGTVKSRVNRARNLVIAELEKGVQEGESAVGSASGSAEAAFAGDRVGALGERAKV